MTIGDALWGTVGAASLAFPGWLIARAARLPQPVLAGFIAGATGLTGVVLAYDASGVRLTFANVGLAWLLLGAAAVAGTRRMSRRARPAIANDPTDSSWREHAPLFLPLLPAFAVVTYRACAQPLFGVDTVFRWNYLAEQMFARASLDFYPPVTAADYAIYSWPDGIAPTVSSLYFWLYGLAGDPRPALTAPLVILQFALLVAGVHALARRYFSARAAAFACALVAGCPLIAWSTAMGQETGLTALALVTLLLYLPRSRAEESASAVVFSALAAGLGGLAREYGLILPVLGIALACLRCLSLRSCVLFGLVALLASAPWYVRNWIHTGNPLFNLALGEFFPVNEIHSWLNAGFHAELGWSHLPPEAPRLLVTNAALALVSLAVGAGLFFRRAPALVVAIGGFVAVWVASVGYTAAGFIYTLRVLNPALALTAVLGGAVLARWIPGRRGRAVAGLGLGLFAVDAALRALTLPANVYRIPPSDWTSVGHALHDYHRRPVYRELARVAGHERMLVLGPNALLATHGARTVPLWSPDVAFVFDASLPAPEIAQRLRAVNIGFVLLTQGRVNERFLARSAFFRDPASALQPVWSDSDMVLLRVQTASP